MNIKEKVNEILGAEMAEKFEKAITAMINESVEARVKEEKAKIEKQYDILSEEYCNKRIAEGVAAEKEALVKQYDEKMVLLEHKVYGDLDSFIDNEIIPQVDAGIIEKIAINEAYQPIVKGFMKVLNENFVNTDSEGAGLLNEAKEEIVGLRKDMNKLMSEKVGLKNKLEQTAKLLVISESTEGLDKSKKEKVFNMFKTKSFDETESKIKEYVNILTESNEEVDPNKKGVINESNEQDPLATPPKPADEEKSQDELALERAAKLVDF